jgi:hypothetical protein
MRHTLGDRMMHRFVVALWALLPVIGVGPAVTAQSPAPDEAVDLVRDFRTVVAVVDPATPGFPDGSLMNADCAFALRLEAQDGSATEWLACTLSEDPVDPPEQQGTRPAAPITTVGGPCIWQSDYWSVTSGRQMVASAFEVTVMPAGQVFGWSTYPSEPLDCPVE